ncbi:MAG: hypothetical protein QOD49_2915 [Actinomycetota bacterium]|nr:hypothetical protein [Actinomycetota bacterium]
MKSTKKLVLAAGISGSIVAGGLVGVTLFGPMAAGANSPATVPAGALALAPAGVSQGWVPAGVPDVTGTATPGVDHSNNSAAHEAGESAATEAAETAGQGHGGGNHVSNKDPAHEATESAARAAEEAARDAAIANSGVKGSTPTSTASG